MPRTSKHRKPRVKGLGAAPEEHRIRVAPLLYRAEQDLRDAERSEQEGDCTRAIEALMGGRVLLGEAISQARESGDREAQQDVLAFRKDWANPTAEIIRRCARKRPAKENLATRMRLRIRD